MWLYMDFTFSRSGSLKAKASSLLSITDAAATSRGVEPLMEGDAATRTEKTACKHEQKHTVIINLSDHHIHSAQKIIKY